MLYRITAKGIETYCSDLIVEEETANSVFFISIAGYQTAVKATIARLLTGFDFTVSIDEDTCWVQRLPGGYRTHFKKLPSGYCQATATTKLAPSPYDEREGKKKFLLISKEPTEVRSGFYRRLDAETDVPLHPSWTDWLWNLFEEEGWIYTLTTLAGTKDGHIVTVHGGALMDRVAQAIKRRVPDIMHCTKPHQTRR